MVLGEPRGKGAPFSQRKLEVLRAAAALFNARGFHNTTMDDIALALSVTKPALYYYAKSKDELLFEIGSIAIMDATDVLREVSESSSSGAEKLRRFFIAWTTSICDDFGKCLVLTKPEVMSTNSRRKSKRARREVQLLVINLINTGIADGSIMKTDPRLLAQAMFDLHNGVAYWYDPKGDKSPLEIADTYWEYLSTGPIRG